MPEHHCHNISVAIFSCLSVACIIMPAESVQAADTSIIQPLQPPYIPVEQDVFFGDTGTTGNVGAGTDDDPDDLLERIMAEIHELRREVVEQKKVIARQESAIEELTERQRDDNSLAMIRGRGFAAADMDTAMPGQNGTDADIPDTPVGEAPPAETQADHRKVDAIPEGQGVLTPRGQLVIDPSFEYTSASTNRLVFRGIELVPGIQIGLIEASDADRDTLAGNLALRYGLSSRLEAEVRFPVLHRFDRIQVAQQRDEGIVREISLKEDNIGDVEFGLRYQINAQKGQRPIWIANLRVKSNSGKGPFDVGYDEFGVATGLATGSGFWGVQPGISMILPSDPAVIFGGLSYLYHIPHDVNRDVAGAFIGHVDPGGAINANIGFGFGLNPRFSFSLGYRHSYIFPSTTEIGNSVERSKRSQIGSFTFGMSYRLSERQSLNLGFELGATADAPDVGITVRMPLRIM